MNPHWRTRYELAVEAARKAGDLARTYYETTFEVEHKADNSPVNSARSCDAIPSPLGTIKFTAAGGRFASASALVYAFPYACPVGQGCVIECVSCDAAKPTNSA